MPVGRAAIEKDVYVVDLEEIGERKVSCRVSAACKRSERDHEGSEGRGGGERDELKRDKGRVLFSNIVFNLFPLSTTTATELHQPWVWHLAKLFRPSLAKRRCVRRHGIPTTDHVV
jgi:hypothetical protein